MAYLHNLSKIINFVFPFTDFLYILQLEEYSSARLLKWLPRFFFRRNIQIREKFVQTRRAMLELAGSVLLYLTIATFIVFIFRQNLLLLLGSQIALLFCIPLVVLLANSLFTIQSETARKKVRSIAAQKLKSSSAKVVVIAGSYGKTTTKNFIHQLVKHSYRTQMIPGNINTPLGIAVWVNHYFDTSTELLIAEVDAYEIGEIAKSCDILDADIAILTNVGDQHVERFGTRKKLAQALSEVFTHSKANAKMICNNETIQEIDEFLPEALSYTQPRPINELSYQKKNLSTIPLSDSNKVNLSFALEVAAILGIKTNFVLDTIQKLELPERRQQLSQLFGFEGIDDSYNISFTTAQAGILQAKKIANAKRKKLLVIAAGIPELAPDNQDKNKALGRFLGLNADFTIVLGSMFSEQITSGFVDKNFITSPSLQSAIKNILPTYPASDWFLLLQPELNDLYY